MFKKKVIMPQINKRVPNLLAIIVLLFSLIFPTFAAAYSYFGYDTWGGTWHDANKTLANTDDDLMCWAAAASNILDWANWDTPTYYNEALIFGNFQYHWTDQGSLMDRGWNWWLNGIEPDDGLGWASVNVSGGGNHWPTYSFNDYFYESWTGNLMASVESYLHDGYGVTLAIYPSGPGGHALTCWGFEYDDNDDYLGIYVTDSDDYDATGLDYYSVTWNSGLQAWKLDGNYNNWRIGGVQALNQNPVPIPGSALLLGSGVLCLVVIGRRRRTKKE